MSNKISTNIYCGNKKIKIKFNHKKFKNKIIFDSPIEILIRYKKKDEELAYTHVPNRKFNSIIEIISYLINNTESEEITYKVKPLESSNDPDDKKF